jgi:hypothetical protein
MQPPKKWGGNGKLNCCLCLKSGRKKDATLQIMKLLINSSVSSRGVGLTCAKLIKYTQVNKEFFCIQGVTNIKHKKYFTCVNCSTHRASDPDKS